MTSFATVGFAVLSLLFVSGAVFAAMHKLWVSFAIVLVLGLAAGTSAYGHHLLHKQRKARKDKK